MKFESLAGGSICNGQLVWSKSASGTRSKEQETHLKELISSSGLGVVLDCALVEVGNSEIVNLLMRIRSQAKKLKKEMVLFNVPETLADVIRVCKLGDVLPQAEDVVAARTLVASRASGKSSMRIWLESHRILAAVLATVGVIVIAFMAFLLK